MTSNEAKVIVYKTSWCGFCKTETQWLDQLGVNYVEKDIEADAAAHTELMEKIGGNFRGVPVTDVAGDLILGFDRPRLEAAMRSHDIHPKTA
ncbi:NrdH-redoxin [Candidatus Saccharibacteria bacterium 32-49-12]|nr:MAG: NrdH-redoxin [Candidatus Saccharibacteria bacterium 32-49-12]